MEVCSIADQSDNGTATVRNKLELILNSAEGDCQYIFNWSRNSGWTMTAQSLAQKICVDLWKTGLDYKHHCNKYASVFVFHHCSYLTLPVHVFQSCTMTEGTTTSLFLLWKIWLGRGSSRSRRRLTLSSHTWRNNTSHTLVRTSNYGKLQCSLIHCLYTWCVNYIDIVAHS